MTIYNYSRELVNGAYNIDNPERSEPLMIEIRNSESLPSCKLIAEENNCALEFEGNLSTEQKTLLDQVVTAHKENL